MLANAPPPLPCPVEVTFADGPRQIPDWQKQFLRGDEETLTYDQWRAERVDGQMLRNFLSVILRPFGR